jgi:translation elongation factor EF-G
MYVSYKESTVGGSSHLLTTDRIFKNKIAFFEVELEIEKLESLEDEDEEIQTQNKDRGARKSEVEIDIWGVNSPTARDFKTFCSLNENMNTKKTKGGVFENSTKKEMVTKEHTFSNDIIDSLYSLESMSFTDLKEIRDMLLELTERGPLTSSQLVNTRIRVVGGRYNPDHLDPVTMKMTVNNCYLQAIRKLSVSMMEPVCKVVVKAKKDVINIITTEAVSKREGKILSMGNEFDQKE